MFSLLPQKQRSPILTQLWRDDIFHAEWDFLSGVYSEIRDILQKEKIRFQDWIEAAIPRLGLVHRDQYLVAFGWRLETYDGVCSLERDPSAAAVMPPASPSMDGLALLESCLADGLALQDEAAARQQLENHDVMLIGPEPQEEAEDQAMIDATVGVPEPQEAVANPPPNIAPEPLELFGALARMNPTAAMAVLLQIPMDSPRLAEGIEFYELANSDDLLNVFQPQRAENVTHDTMMMDMGILLPGTASMLQPMDAFAVNTLPDDTMQPVDALQPVTDQDILVGEYCPRCRLWCYLANFSQSRTRRTTTRPYSMVPSLSRLRESRAPSETRHPRRRGH